MSPRFTVVVPCFNDGAWLSRALDSVLAQGREDTEVVVTDDGSTDPGTLEQLARLEGGPVRLLRHDANRGLAAARNTAIRAARGTVIVPLDADDELPAGALAAMDGAFTAGVDHAWGRCVNQWPDGRRTLRDPGPLANWEDARWIPWVGCSPFSRELWERLGGYDERFSRRGWPEDLDFWARARGLGAKGVYVNADLYIYHRRAGTLASEVRPEWLAAVRHVLAVNPGLVSKATARRMTRDTALHAASFYRRRARNLRAALYLLGRLTAEPLWTAGWRAVAGALRDMLLRRPAREARPEPTA
jgi:glycosyltransferase involved in cell wall biosynthesis